MTRAPSFYLALIQHVDWLRPVVKSPMEELEKGLKELKSLQPHRKNNNINQPDSPELPGTKPSTKEGPTAPATYVTEDDLVRHQWEERPLVL